jgi:uncharacterized protein (TIGR03000 family)
MFMRRIASVGRAGLTMSWLLLALVPVWALAADEADKKADDKAEEKKPATIVVQVPADARLLIDGEPTKATGETRRFVSPPLEPGKSYHYVLEVITRGKDGKEVHYKKTVHVRAGRESVVDMRQPPEDTDDTGKTEKPDKTKPDKTKPDKTKPGTGDKTGKDEKPEREPDIFFLPTPQKVVDRMLELADVKKSDVVYDLGCGDGRIVVTAAKKYGCKAVGFDIDPARVKDSLENVKKAGVEDLVTIKKADIFKLDLSPASVVALYLLPELNVKLIPQLQKLKPGSRVVSHDFAMEGVTPKKVETVKSDDGREHKIYLWIAPIEKSKEK